jgi:hypothetical protein
MTAPFRPDDAATYFGIESAFDSDTPPSMLRGFPVGGSFEPTINQAELEVNTESVYLYDYKPPVLGMQDGGCKFSCYVRPDTTQLGSESSSVPFFHPLKALFGGMDGGAGTTTSAAASATSITATSAAGFGIGQWVLPTVSGTTEPCRISNIVANALTFDLGASATPTASTSPLTGMYNFYPTPGNTLSLYVQHANANETTNEKYSFRGCTGDLGLKFDRNQILVADFDLKAASWSCPSADTIATTVGTDTMGSCFVLKDATVILQSTATATRTTYPIVSFGAKLNMGMQHTPNLTGRNGVGGVVRVGQRLFAETTVRVYADQTDTATIVAYWTNRTALQFVAMVPSGSGSTKRWCVFDMPKCIVVGRPKPVKDGGRMCLDITLRSQMRSTSGSTDQARTPFTLAIG